MNNLNEINIINKEIPITVGKTFKEKWIDYIISSNEVACLWFNGIKFKEIFKYGNVGTMEMEIAYSYLPSKEKKIEELLNEYKANRKYVPNDLESAMSELETILMTTCGDSIYDPKSNSITSYISEIDFIQEYGENIYNEIINSATKNKNKKVKQPSVKNKAKKPYKHDFDNTYGYVYVLRCWNRYEEFYKIGITKHKDIRRRYTSSLSMPYEYELVYLIRSYDPRGVEKLLHNKHREFSYMPNIEFDGFTECFTDIMVDEIEKTFK